MCTIESCVGVGEIAVSDHRSSCPTPHELARIARWHFYPLPAHPSQALTKASAMRLSDTVFVVGWATMHRSSLRNIRAACNGCFSASFGAGSNAY